MTGHDEQSDWERRLRDRKILKLKPESEVCIKRDVHTLDVELPEVGDPAERFAQAFGEMMAEDGAEFGLITLRRPKNETGQPFVVGHRVLSQNSSARSCRLTIVRTQQPAKTFTTLHGPSTGFWHPVNESIPKSLVRALEVVVINVLVDRMTQMALAQRDDPAQAFGFDR